MFEDLFEKQGLSLDRLRNFLMVVECGSIAEAADREPSRQSLLSRQIGELEVFFGVELTKREGKGLAITDEGLELARVARASFTMLEDFLLRQRNASPVFRIGAGFSTMQWIILPSSREIASCLGMELETVRMRSRDAASLLRSGEIDMAVVRADAVDANDSRLVVYPLGECGYSMFGSDVASLPLAVPTGGGQFEMALTDSFGSVEGNRIRCGSLLQIASLVADGQARAVLPDIARAAFRRMDWITSKPYPKLRKYRRRWVMVASRRQLEIRGVSEAQQKACAAMLKL